MTLQSTAYRTLPDSIVDKAKAYGIKCHADTNHLYDDKPYSYHLEMVFRVATYFQDLIPAYVKWDVLASCWVHDCIEDCRQTYNDVRRATNGRVAEIAYALTNEKGKTRKERANGRYYQGIRDTEFATFVKLCDRIANTQHSMKTGSHMLDVYRNENGEFCRALYDGRYTSMFQVLLAMLLKGERIEFPAIFVS